MSFIFGLKKKGRENECSSVSWKFKCRKFSEEEFLVDLTLIIGAAEIRQKGVDYFSTKDTGDKDDVDVWHSIGMSPHFEQYMAFSRLEDIAFFT
jgi:hypothetical protein